ncbi:MAG: glycoside hydrolase family 38 C-terminal domain-containing protein, partial [Chloroflexota bacterium]
MPKRKTKDPDRSPDMPHEWISRHIERLAPFATYAPIDVTAWEYRRTQLVDTQTYVDIDTEWRPIQIGETWGGPDTTGLFRCELTIPESHANQDAFLDIDLDGGETQLSINGYPWQGLDRYRSLVPLGDLAQAGKRLQLGLEAFIINYPYDERVHDAREWHRFKRARLVLRDRAVETFVNAARFVLDAYLDHWQKDSSLELEGYLRHYLEEACRKIGPHITSQAAAREAASEAHCVLRKHVFESDHFRTPGQIDLCAHSHLDLVYLWPLKETLRKNCRTTTNMLSLMREYPDYCYTQSQPYLYEQLQAQYPEVFAEMCQRIHEGRWEVVGAMYVEPDGNLLGPESLVRQIMFGKRYLREELGVDTVTLWFPDVFGIMYTLPQVLRKSGVRYFMTNKLNIWNDTTVFPYDSFRWRGLDGSEIITHFPPTHFAQDLTPGNLRRHWQDYREKEAAPVNLFVYGWGDGGGGPTREMVQASQQIARFPGLPTCQIEKAETFFDKLEVKADDLPVWDDELYLEAHRGTLTTRADLKRDNRQAELLYRDAEILSAFAQVYGGARVQERLNLGWKKVLLNQFHDTLPGTHVPAAIPDVQRDYAKAFEIGQSVRDQALKYLSDHIDHDNEDVVIFNTLGWQRRALIAAPQNKTARSIVVGKDEEVAVQHFEGKAYFPATLPSLGWTTGRWTTTEPSGLPSRTATFDAVKGIIETQLYRIELDHAGEFKRIYDTINDRDVLSGKAGLQVFEDDPGRKFSAWDIAYHFEEYRYPVDQTTPWKLVTNGPHFAVFRCVWQVLDSTIEQEMWLYADEARIDFKTKAAWQNHRKLLKASFPLNIRSRTATYDLPFGHIERATHRNTIPEQAKFEVCGHKWADLSEGDYGVSILNDCKYGYDALENRLRISLIRSPVRPDANSDIGQHEFTYALYPHAGGWRAGGVDRAAYGLNVPPILSELSDQSGTPFIPMRQSLIKTDSPSVIVEVLKQAERGERKDLILRTFDSHGSRRAVSIEVGLPPSELVETDLLEEQPEPVQTRSSHAFVSRYDPYEIKTHRLT